VPPWGKKKEEKFTPQMLGGRCHQHRDWEERDGVRKAQVYKQYFAVSN
jgi:hypothetical protein